MIRFVAPLSMALLLAACASQPPAPMLEKGAPHTSSRTAQPAPVAAAPAPVIAGPGQYQVKRGDTLYRIALENGQDYRDIAAWNGITAPYLIREGQILRVQPSSADGGAVVARPVVGAPVVESRSLDAPPPAASIAPDGSSRREPRVGKEPYSDEAYARLNRQEGARPAPETARPEPRPETPPPAVAAPLAGDEVAWAWPSSGKLLAPYSEAGNKGLDIGGKAGDPVLAAGDGKVVYAGAGLRGYGELVIVKHNGTYLSAYAHNRKILVKEGQAVTRGQKIAEMGNTDADTVKLHFEIRRQGKPIDPLQFLPKK